MGRGKVRLRAGKGKRWRKGQSSSSNPETKKHRMVAKGKLGSHLSQAGAGGVANRPGTALTKEALATHDAIQGDRESLRIDKYVLVLVCGCKPGTEYTVRHNRRVWCGWSL
jgi:hypothetical protein